jgi:DNA mismatch repair protein MutS
LLSERLYQKDEIPGILAPWKHKLVIQPNSRFDSENCKRRVLTIYHVSDLGSFGDFSRVEITALGALLDYVSLTQRTDLKHFARPQKTGGTQVAIDASTRRNLELVRTLSGERHGSLLECMDRTETGAGARLLATRLTSPLTDLSIIQARLDAVSFFVSQASLREVVRSSLRHIPDLERALARLALARGGPRDLASVRDALRHAEHIRATLSACRDVPDLVQIDTIPLGGHERLVERLERALTKDLPLLARDGNFIARGYADDLDHLLTLRDDGRRLVAALQQKYATASNISTLKIKHNQVIGYHIEVTPSQAERLLADKEFFIHRQTLATAARFTTIELTEMEKNITEAADKALAIELQLFDELVDDVLENLEALRQAAQMIACFDVSAALAELACEQHYTRPIVDQSLCFDIKGGRHPVVEQALQKNGQSAFFIANDCSLDRRHFLWLLTGPNMAGKSTFLRQNALIALMAQMGSFVPAEAAHIGLIDRLFSRVGAADDLAAGRSTFMVEMVETAAILTQASERSLVILDEIGRGTSTYDGLSIAWAVLEHLHAVNKCRALFATHYHELTVLSMTLEGLKCATMRIKEWNGEIVFLHEVIEGVADRSYGIHVAQMAGLPPATIARAEVILKQLEKKKNGAALAGDEFAAYDPCVQTTELDEKIAPELKNLLLSLDPDVLTPKDALEIVYKIKAIGLK